jgi:hypothetical protein
MKETGILFSAPMVHALLAGCKAQTRRVCKPAEDAGLSYVVGIRDPRDLDQRPLEVQGSGWFGDEAGDVQFRSPYGRPGDHLWVRETFFAYGRWEIRYSEKEKRDEWRFVDMTLECGWTYQYAADNPDLPLAKGRSVTPGWCKRPAIHMPRVASRIQLKVIGVRVERLQDLSDADAVAEGIDRAENGFSNGPSYRDYSLPDSRDTADWFTSPTDSYRTLWGRINGPGSWEANPWIWVVEFRRVKP